ncbi:hypothetical protein THAR02_01071 [Trichoderma harzianum]|uniref:GPI inositol-deacylase winged helix domain-containing protein n=1 Tax=Trichoderma harzianum TaxID=5544 RepID=A0A0G0AQS8_TRIHA|nr:hypothetical protein THAR02_01071 [Trichoderma harzianum]
MEKFEACKRMEIRASEDDVRRYLLGQLDGGNMEHLPSLIKHKPDLKDEIIKGISDAVDGMFLLAKIYLDTLVDKVTVTDVREAVAQLPKQVSGSREDKRLEILHQAYESAWERINGQKEGFRNLARRVLAWISSAKRPLSTKELQHALAVKIGMDELDKDAIPQVQDMVSFCAGLVTVDERSRVIRLVHYTTQEFFDRKKSDWFPNAEAMIAEACISYLSLEEFGEYCLDESDLDESDLDESDLDESDLNYLCSCGFYEYASCYWGDHARVAGRKMDGSVIGFLMSGAKASSAFHVMRKYFLMNGISVCHNYMNLVPNVVYDDFRFELFSPVSGLHLAVHFELDEAINIMIKSGCDVNGRKGLEMTPLLMAIDHGHIGIAEMLLDNGAHMGSVPDQSLIYLAFAMQPENYSERLVQRLIAKGISDGEDFSLYVLPAAEFGHEAIVKFLLDKGANTNATDDLKERPLHMAIINGHEEIVKLLLKKGADIEVANITGHTPLHSAVRNFNEATVKLLLDEGANIEAADAIGVRPLHLAVENPNEAAVKLLLDEGANIEAEDDMGVRPLHLAVENSNEAAVKSLIDRGANIIVVGKYM